MVFILSKIKCFFRLLQSAALQDRGSRKYWRMLETGCFFIMTALFEGIGVYGIDFLMDQLGLMPENVVISSSIEMAFSKLVLIFFYYALLRRFLKKDYR